MRQDRVLGTLNHRDSSAVTGLGSRERRARYRVRSRYALGGVPWVRVNCRVK